MIWSHGPAGDLQYVLETRGVGHGAVPRLKLSKNQWQSSTKHKNMGALGLGPGALLMGRNFMDLASWLRNTTGLL